MYVWMCGCVYECVGVCMYECVHVCMYEFCNVWVFVCVGFAMCGCFVNMYTLYILCFCIVSFMYIYSYLLLVQGLLPPSGNSIAVDNNIARMPVPVAAWSKA